MSIIIDIASMVISELFKENPVITTFLIIIGLSLVALFSKTSLSSCFKKVSIKHYVVKMQMEKYEEMSDEAEDVIQKLFLKMRYEILGTKKGLIDDEVVKHFNLIMNLLKKKSRKKVRSFFWENHLAEMTEIEAEAHYEKRAEQILRHLNDFYNSWYPEGVEPTVEAFYDRYVIEKRDTIKNMIKESFRYGRSVSISFTDKKYIKKFFKEL